MSEVPKEVRELRIIAVDNGWIITDRSVLGERPFPKVELVAETPNKVADIIMRWAVSQVAKQGQL